MPVNAEPLLPPAGAVGWILLDAFAMLAVVILVVRLAGLRSFAKMSSFDFAVTVATGSLLATVVVNRDVSFVHGFLAVAALLLAQVAVALGRLHLPAFKHGVDNRPLLLMDGPRILDANLAAGRVTRDDLVAKLREANVSNREQVLAVVLETTGDISVLHGKGPLDDEVMAGVRRTP